MYIYVWQFSNLFSSCPEIKIFVHSASPAIKGNINYTGDEIQ